MTDSMYYIYYPKNSKVYGVSIDVLKFLELNDSFMESFSHDCTVEVDRSEFLDSKISNSKFIQPVLYYLRRF
jgi:hypothetical protein